MDRQAEVCIWKTLQFWQAPKGAAHLSLVIFNMSSLGAPVPNSLCNSCWNSWWMSCSCAIYEILLHFLEPTISSHLPTKTGLTNQVLQEAEGQVFWVAWNEFFWNSHWSMGRLNLTSQYVNLFCQASFVKKGHVAHTWACQWPFLGHWLSSLGFKSALKSYWEEVFKWFGMPVS